MIFLDFYFFFIFLIFLILFLFYLPGGAMIFIKYYRTMVITPP